MTFLVCFVPFNINVQLIAMSPCSWGTGFGDITYDYRAEKLELTCFFNHPLTNLHPFPLLYSFPSPLLLHLLFFLSSQQMYTNITEIKHGLKSTKENMNLMYICLVSVQQELQSVSSAAGQNTFIKGQQIHDFWWQLRFLLYLFSFLITNDDAMELNQDQLKGEWTTRQKIWKTGIVSLKKITFESRFKLEYTYWKIEGIIENKKN